MDRWCSVSAPGGQVTPAAGVQAWRSWGRGPKGRKPSVLSEASRLGLCQWQEAWVSLETVVTVAAWGVLPHSLCSCGGRLPSASVVPALPAARLQVPWRWLPRLSCAGWEWLRSLRFVG